MMHSLIYTTHDYISLAWPRGSTYILAHEVTLEGEMKPEPFKQFGPYPRFMGAARALQEMKRIDRMWTENRSPSKATQES